MAIDLDQWLKEPGYSIPAPSAGRNIVITNADGKVVVNINTATGAITFGEGMPPDEAARQGWDILSKVIGASCK